jgi:hypothetical protein
VVDRADLVVGIGELLRARFLDDVELTVDHGHVLRHVRGHDGPGRRTVDRARSSRPRCPDAKRDTERPAILDAQDLG